MVYNYNVNNLPDCTKWGLVILYCVGAVIKFNNFTNVWIVKTVNIILQTLIFPQILRLKIFKTCKTGVGN